MYYHVLIIQCDIAFQDIVIAQLAHLPFETFEYTDLGIKAYINSTSITSNFKTLVKNSIGNIETQISWEAIEEENWNKEWESNFDPVEIEKFCRIRAPFHEPSSAYKHELIINPEMAFGTGHHETTYMVALMMKNLDFRNKKVLDFGCGTGILANLASKLGATQITAVDNDEKAIRNSLENNLLNAVGNIKVKLSTADIIDGSDFDIILANINKNVLLHYADRLHILLKANGVILLSGILKKDELEIKKVFENAGFSYSIKMEKGEWIALCFNKF